MHGFARAGFAVNGVLHVIMGAITFAVAFGEKGTANHDGALAQLATGPIGGLLLWTAVVGLCGLAFFQVLTFALVRGTSRQAWVARSKPFGRALSSSRISASSTSASASSPSASPWAGLPTAARRKTSARS